MRLAPPDFVARADCEKDAEQNCSHRGRLIASAGLRAQPNCVEPQPRACRHGHEAQHDTQRQHCNMLPWTLPNRHIAPRRADPCSCGRRDVPPAWGNDTPLQTARHHESGRAATAYAAWPIRARATRQAARSHAAQPTLLKKTGAAGARLPSMASASVFTFAQSKPA